MSLATGASFQSGGRRLLEEHKYPYDWLVDTNYQQAVKSVNPEGKTVVDKWGSSFDSGGKWIFSISALDIACHDGSLALF